MSRPFAYLSSELQSESVIAEALISTFLNNDMEITIIKTRSSFFDIFLHKGIKTAKIKSATVYTIDDFSKLKAGISLMTGMMWHMPIFHILIARKGFKDKIINLCRDQKRDVFSIEKELKHDILCTIEPLDGVLQFYAAGFVEKIIKDVFPKLELD